MSTIGINVPELIGDSATYRSMHAGNQEVPRVLKRPYETAKVVRCFLELVAHGELALDDDASSLQVISVVKLADWEDLAMFLDTWSCESTNAFSGMLSGAPTSTPTKPSRSRRWSATVRPVL